MIETQLNLFDAVVIGIMALSCLFAFFRGFVREVLSLFAWVGAGLITIYYFPDVAEKLTPHFKNPVVAAGVATLGLYIGALILFSIITRIILKFVKSGAEVGMLDNFFGLLFGAFRGAFIVSLGFFLMSIVLPEKQQPQWLVESQTRPYVERGAQMLASAAPKYMREIGALQDKADKAVKHLKKDDDTDTGDGEDTAHNLDRLLQHSDGDQ